MGLSAPLKVLAFVVFIAAIAGATYGVREAIGENIQAQFIRLSTPHAEINATGGHNVTFIVTVLNRDLKAQDVSLEIEGLLDMKAAPVRVPGNASHAFLVTGHVPEDAPVGEHPLSVRLLSGGEVLRTNDSMFTLRVMEPGPGLEVGGAAQVTFVGRIAATDRVYQTNDPALPGVPFAKTPTYTFARGPLTVRPLSRETLVGVAEGTIGQQVGEMRTLTIPFSKAYGPAVREDKRPEIDSIVRELVVPNPLLWITPAQWPDATQGQRVPLEVGARFTLTQPPNVLPYRVTEVTDDRIYYRSDLQVGNRTTIYPAWPNASVVTSINDSAVIFLTTPTTAPGEKITVLQYWPQMSSLVEYNDTHIQVRHAPPVGYQYVVQLAQGQTQEATIRSVANGEITVSFPSAHPLAGQDLIIDVTVNAIAPPPPPRT